MVVLTSATEGDYVLSFEGSAHFSDSNEVVNVELEYEALRGTNTHLNSGNDEYLGTVFQSPFPGNWDNNANGNRGADELIGGLGMPGQAIRDNFEGGKDDDFVYGGSGGNDYLQGNFGDDTVWGSKSGQNVIRGGRDDDTLIGGARRDMILGDFGTDILEGGGGSDFFMLRTDSNNEGLRNATANELEADRITDYDVAKDFIVLSGVTSKVDYTLEANGAGDTLVKVMQSGDQLIAGVIEGVNHWDINTANVILGDTAEEMLASADPNNFLINQTMLDSFGF